ncbi:hypothetical protein Aperf_G00000129222 [Anoplocephala perfoliata]
MKRIARRDSPVHKRYRRDDDSNGRESNSYRGYGMQGSRSRPLQQSPAYERHNPRTGTPSFSRSHRDYVESGRHGGTGSYRSGPSVRRFSQRSPGNSGGTRASDMYNPGSHSDRLLQSIVGGGELGLPSGTKIDPVFAAAAAAALNATLSASNASSANMYPPSSSTVAAVAAAAMNAAAIAAAFGGSSSQSNGASGTDFQLPGLGSQHSLKGSGGNRSPPYERRGAGGYRSSRTREHDSPPYRNDSRRAISNLGGGHPSPEDDPFATRTLFVGNLPPDIHASDLHQIFDVYGIIEDIDIKHPQSGSPNEPAYAFLKFVNVSMAYRAKLGMTGKRIDGYVCKVGYGKVTPTRCLWVGGLGPWTNYPMFASLVERVSRPKKIVWPSGKGYANILYHSTEAAASAANALRGRHLGTGNHRIRVDFTDESHMINSGTIDSLRRGRPSGSGAMDKAHRFRRESDRHQRSASRSLRPPNRRSRSVSSIGARSPSGHVSRSQSRSRSHSQSPAVGVSDDVSMEATTCSINEVTSCLPGPVWKAVFVLKKSNFSCHLHAVSGETALVDQLFPRHRPKPPQTPPDDEEDSNMNEGEVTNATEGVEKTTSLISPESKNRVINNSSAVNLPLLRISQRLRLNPPKCEEIKKRMKTVDHGDFCMLLATESANEVLPAMVKAEDADNHNRPLSDLINYLASKEAAGVVVVSTNEQGDEEHPTLDSEHSRVLHVLPPGELSISLLVNGGIPSLRQKRVESGDNYLVILLSKNSGFM